MRQFSILFTLMLILVLTFRISAQDLPLNPETNKVTYSEVIEVKGASKDDLYLRAKNWALSNSYKPKTDRKAEGSYITKGQFTVQYPSPMKGMNHSGKVTFTMSISLKDGKYRYEMTDFIHESDRGNGGKLENTDPACGKYTLVPAGWSKIKSLTPDEVEKIIKSLKEAMDSNYSAQPVKKSEDW